MRQRCCERNIGGRIKEENERVSRVAKKNSKSVSTENRQNRIMLVLPYMLQTSGLSKRDISKFWKDCKGR